MALKPFEHIVAGSLEEAVALKPDRKHTAVVAGGTDLLGALKDNIHPDYPERLVDLKPLRQLAGIREDRNGLRIGALTTLSEVCKSPVVREKAPLLAEAARTVASPQIRNMGTVGGNLCQEPRCWYYRTPENHFHCLRKGGEVCAALLGENRFHSIFGAAHTALPGCASACPAHVPIPAYLAQLRAGELGVAARMILSRNPMPAITGRVCPHYCQQECNRCDLDEAVSTRAVERKIGDHTLDEPGLYFAPPAAQGKKSVAVVGAGPAGLAAAFYLRRLGHKVTVIDKMPEAGGMLRYCIPAYRLPKDLLARQIAAYEQMGITFQLGVELGSKKGPSLETLRKRHDAVFVATGAWRQKKLGLEREELLSSGIDFLVEVQKGLRQAPGKKVLVIGGGSVAVDVAIAAARLGAKDVTMASLEARDIMPAFPEDLELAVQQGIKLLPSWGPQKVLEKNGKITGLELVRCTSVFNAEGRFRPTFDPESTKTIKADCVMLAIGTSADLRWAAKNVAQERGLIVAEAESQQTSLADVFAGGDAVSGASTVVAAIAAGRRAALAIDAKLRKGAVVEEPVMGGLHPVNLAALEARKAARVRVRAVSARSISKEDAASIDWPAAKAEAHRCLACGCVAVNASDLAPALVALGAKIATTERTIAAEEFFAAGVASTTALRPGELVTEIRIPPAPAGSRQRYHKFRIRNAIDFPIVGVASLLALDGKKVKEARIALGAVAPVPMRATEAEQFLVGKSLTEQNAEVAAGLAVKAAQPLAKNAYKVQIVKALLRKSLLA
jgi:NADPH-dependent glutamate synthase beta subunit-like oxidoreductase/CO/xanthine dehydrogenase FAD-binding subunit